MPLIKMPDREVSLEFLAEIIDTASRDIGYWAEVVVFRKTEQPEYYEMQIKEDEPDVEPGIHKVTLETIQQGIQRMLVAWETVGRPAPNKGRPVPDFGQLIEWLIEAVNDQDNSIVDSDLADAIVQYGVFSELVYS